MVYIPFIGCLVEFRLPLVSIFNYLIQIVYLKYLSFRKSLLRHIVKMLCLPS